jgi:cytochrome b involved in lipid metabolism
MRPLLLASAVLLVLSGCTDAEPQPDPTEVLSAQVESVEPTESSAEPERAAQPEPSADVESSPEESEEATSTQTEGPEESEVEESEQEERENEREDDDEAESSPSPTPTATQTQAPEPEVVGYSLAEVSLRNTPAECWVAISGNVYKLTQWIGEHPGGEERISRLCGKDGTSQFLSMHGGQSDAEAELQSNLIGPLR